MSVYLDCLLTTFPHSKLLQHLRQISTLPTDLLQRNNSLIIHTDHSWNIFVKVFLIDLHAYIVPVINLLLYMTKNKALDTAAAWQIAEINLKGDFNILGQKYYNSWNANQVKNFRNNFLHFKNIGNSSSFSHEYNMVTYFSYLLRFLYKKF